MLEETGVVTRLDGLKAIVSVPRKSACEGCTAGTCKPEEQGMEIEAVNRVGAQVGQRVRVAIHTYPYLMGSMIVYGIPALFLVIGAVIGRELLAGRLPGRDPDIISAVCGFGGFLFSFLLVKFWAGRHKTRPEKQPVIEAILEQ